MGIVSLGVAKRHNSRTPDYIKRDYYSRLNNIPVRDYYSRTPDYIIDFFVIGVAHPLCASCFQNRRIYTYL